MYAIRSYYVCCGGLLAIPALVLSIMSTTSFNAGNIEEAKNRANIAKWLSIGAIVLGVLAYILFFVLFYTTSSSYTYY